MVKEVTKTVIKEVTKDIQNYNFNFAAEKLYEFIWHEFADKYIEQVKTHPDSNGTNLKTSKKETFIILLKLLHPFMPFVTEEIYQRLEAGDSIMISKWPL